MACRPGRKITVWHMDTGTRPAVGAAEAGHLTRSTRRPAHGTDVHTPARWTCGAPARADCPERRRRTVRQALHPLSDSASPRPPITDGDARILGSALSAAGSRSATASIRVDSRSAAERVRTHCGRRGCTAVGNLPRSRGRWEGRCGALVRRSPSTAMDMAACEALRRTEAPVHGLAVHERIPHQRFQAEFGGVVAAS